MRRVYLSGPITGCTYKGATEWRTQVRLELEDAGYMVLDPLRGKCVHPETRLLTGTFQWIHAKDVAPGTDLIGFDAQTPGRSNRRLRRSTVIQSERVYLPTTIIQLSNGTELISASDHPWLVDSPNGHHRRWILAKNLQPGMLMPRFFQPWEPPTALTAWLGGFLDGEGCLAQGPCLFVSASQLPGVVWDRATEILRQMRISFRVASKISSSGNEVLSFAVRGKIGEQARLIASTGSNRLLHKLMDWYEGHTPRAIERPRVVRRINVSPSPLQAIQTTTETYFAEGYGAHNSFLSSQTRIAQEADARDNPRISDKALVMRDRSDVHASDVILVNLLGSRIVSIGTMFELAWANLLHKLIVIVVDPENVHAKHPFVRESGVLFSDLESAVDYVKSCHVREGA